MEQQESVSCLKLLPFTCKELLLVSELQSLLNLLSAAASWQRLCRILTACWHVDALLLFGGGGECVFSARG